MAPEVCCPPGNMQPVEGLRLPCNRRETEVVAPVSFRLFPMWRITSSGFHAYFAPKRTREMHDLIKSAWIFQRSWTSWHRVFHMFPTLVDQATSESLERHRLLTPAVTRVAIIITSTKNKLSSLCNCVWLCLLCLDSVGEEDCSCVIPKITPVLC